MPHLTFFCELEPQALVALFRDPQIVADLTALGAGVSLGLLDLSPQRAAIVRQLNAAGIPVTAWLLLPRTQGYYFYLDNASQAGARYADFKRWTVEEDLRWAAVALDIEPDLREMEGTRTEPWRIAETLLRRTFNSSRLRQGLAQYRDLVAWIRADGYQVEAYQFPLIVDERRAGSTLLQRATGIMDLPVDREVLMLYTSLVPGREAALWSYARDAQGIGVGSTGGGLDMQPKLGWAELARDLRLAHCWTEDLYIFSLEGCVRQNLLARLRDFDWREPVLAPFGPAAGVDRARLALQAALWIGARPALLLIVPSLLVLARLLRKK
jgi:hypothetical protein